MGDPLTEVAALRVRDTIKNLGDLSEIAEHWSQITGEQLDHDVIVFHTVAYNAQTVLSAAPLIEAPAAGGDLMSHLGWYVNSARWAFEDIADLLGVVLEPVAPPTVEPSRSAAPLGLLVDTLANRGPELSVGDHERAKLFRVARHLRRIDEVGASLLAADLDDAEAVLGERPTAATLDAALVAAIAAAGPERDAELVGLLDRQDDDAATSTFMCCASVNACWMQPRAARSVRIDATGLTRRAPSRSPSLAPPQALSPPPAQPPAGSPIPDHVDRPLEVPSATPAPDGNPTPAAAVPSG